MKSFKKYLCLTALIMTVILAFTACGNMGPNYYQRDSYYYSGDEYNKILENNFIKTSQTAESTFSMDINTASYSNIRRHINESLFITPDMVRIDEMLNYFKFDYSQPEEGEPLSINTAIMPCPWNEQNKLLSIGLKAEDIELSDVKNNIVFLLDVSGSMNSADKLGLMKSAFTLLVESLKEDDVISIVTYANGVRVVLEGAKGNNPQTILDAIDSLTASGGTSGGKGIQKAYEIAQKYKIEGGNNRVILGTDGDFNVGISSQAELEKFISEKRDLGIPITILGFGLGNLKDNKMETIAKNGNGNYAYIDTLIEARRVLVECLSGTLHIVAKDVKTQVIFNPARVNSYRLIGYENKLLSNEDWENQAKDSGDIGAGYYITAVYELIMETETDIESTMDENILQLSIKYKKPDATSESPSLTLSRYTTEENIVESLTDDQKFITAVVEAGLILRNSKYKANADINSIISRLNSIDSLSDDFYKGEFLQLMLKLKLNIHKYNYQNDDGHYYSEDY